jgi:hypothetical protein
VELSELLGLKRPSVAKHLAKLCAYDLAACCPEGRWRRLDNLDAAAKKLGIAGEGERQRERYRYEREIYQAAPPGQRLEARNEAAVVTMCLSGSDGRCAAREKLQVE